MATANPLQQPASQASNVLGKFKLIAELGRGGMSEVYLAVIAGPAGFNKLVVVKLIKGELAEDPDFISMFLEEARLSARLSHPNVVQTNEVGEFGGRYYIAMEYLEGQAYSRILHRLGRDRGLPLGMSLRTLSDVLQGLHYAHELPDFDGSPLGVVHRDVTPHNVFITYDGQVKVVDFGIAKAMNSSHETRTGMLKGKVGYMAPEQARGERVDRRADIFSVGVMLWEAAVGKRLWKGLNEVQILHQLLSGDIPSPRSMRPDISSQLESIIMKAVASDRDKRHSTALELQGELEDLMDSGNERNTLREVGRLLSQTFEDERRKLKGIIEQQVQKSSMVATGLYQQMAIPSVDQPPAFTGEVPRLSMGPVSGSVQGVSHISHSGMSQSGIAPHMSYSQSSPSHQSGSHQNPLNVPSFNQSQSGYAAQPQAPSSYSQSGVPGHNPQQHGMQSPSTFSGSYPGAAHNQQHGQVGQLPRFSPPMSGSEPGHSSHPSYSNSINHASVASHRQLQKAPASTNRLTLIALGVAAAAGGAAALLYVGFAKPAGDTANAAPAPVDAQPASTPAPTSTTVTATTATPTPADDAKNMSKVSIKVTPDTADIWLDGKKVGTGTYEGTIAREGKPREVKVEAAGFVAKTKSVKADEDVIWEVDLAADKRAVATPQGVTTVPTAKTTATAEPTQTSTSTPPQPERDKNGRLIRKIDPSYPGSN